MFLGENEIPPVVAPRASSKGKKRKQLPPAPEPVVASKRARKDPVRLGEEWPGQQEAIARSLRPAPFSSLPQLGPIPRSHGGVRSLDSRPVVQPVISRLQKICARKHAPPTGSPDVSAVSSLEPTVCFNEEEASTLDLSSAAERSTIMGKIDIVHCTYIPCMV